MAAEVTCVHPVREQLPWYLNGSLEGPEAAAVSAHLDTCEACSAELTELSSFAAGIDRHGVPPRPAEAVSRGRDVWRFRVAAGLAAGLAIPALLGIYWGALGFPRGAASGSGSTVGPAPPPGSGVPAPPAEAPGNATQTPETPAPTLAVAVALDLGGGAPRGGDETPSLVVPDRLTAVVVAFRRPPDLPGPPRLELRDASGTALAHVEADPGTDRAGRSSCVIPGALLNRPGEYFLVFTGGGREFSYPFRVVAP